MSIELCKCGKVWNKLVKRQDCCPFCYGLQRLHKEFIEETPERIKQGKKYEIKLRMIKSVYLKLRRKC